MAKKKIEKVELIESEEFKKNTTIPFILGMIVGLFILLGIIFAAFYGFYWAFDLEFQWKHIVGWVLIYLFLK